MNKIIDNQRGSALIAASFLVFVFSMSAMALTQSVATEGGSTANNYSRSQAFYVGSAGLEYTKRKLDQGENPDVTNKSFNNGTLTITTSPVTRIVTVVSNYGGSTMTQTINSNFAKDCAALNVASAIVSGKDINNVLIAKTCNTYVNIAKMTLSWNWHTCVTSAAPGADISGCPVDTGGAVVKHIGIDGTAIYNPGLGIGSPGGGGADSGQEIDVVNYLMTINQNYNYVGPPHGIRISANAPSNGAYTIFVEFTDGSVGSASFRN